MKQKQKQNIPWDILFCLSPISLCNFQINNNKLAKKIHLDNTENTYALYNGTIGSEKSTFENYTFKKPALYKTKFLRL